MWDFLLVKELMKDKKKDWIFINNIILFFPSWDFYFVRKTSWKSNIKKKKKKKKKEDAILPLRLSKQP